MTFQQPRNDFAVTEAIARAYTQLFVSLTPFTVANKPAAADYPWKLIFLSDGAGNKFVAVSNGTAWHYLEGTAV